MLGDPQCQDRGTLLQALLFPSTSCILPPSPSTPAANSPPDAGPQLADPQPHRICPKEPGTAAGMGAGPRVGRWSCRWGWQKGRAEKAARGAEKPDPGMLNAPAPAMGWQDGNHGDGVNGAALRCCFIRTDLRPSRQMTESSALCCHSGNSCPNTGNLGTTKREPCSAHKNPWELPDGTDGPELQREDPAAPPRPAALPEHPPGSEQHTGPPRCVWAPLCYVNPH